MLTLSNRQIRRLIKRVEEEGDIGIIHKSRGKPSNRRLPKKIKGTALVFNVCEEVVPVSEPP
ncbi:MAG: hypothetical protein AB1610_11475 [Nitrospirota bacterium]